MSSQQTSPGIAAALSAFMPGLGQIYCGSIGRGLMFLIGIPFAISLFAVFLILAGAAGENAGAILMAYAVLLLGGGVNWIVSIFDAYGLASSSKRRPRRRKRRKRRDSDEISDEIGTHDSYSPRASSRSSSSYGSKSRSRSKVSKTRKFARARRR